MARKPQTSGIAPSGVQPKMSAVTRPSGDALINGGGWGPPPVMTPDQLYRPVGSSGLRAFSGWIKEEFLPNLQGREAARTYREMLDNSPTVGAINFAIIQTMREINWRVVGAADTPEHLEAVAFVESCMDDMRETWSDFVTEALTMLPFGYAPCEKVFKRRNGRKPAKGLPQSKWQDGKIGWSKLPLRGQETVLKWFFSDDGEMAGMTQQPWIGPIIDIPAQKLLLFRPRLHKNNPEGYSILRSAYRPYFFVKRLEEMEAISLERLSGTPQITVPNQILSAAAGGDATAISVLETYKRIVTNVRMDEQMGLILPSDTWPDQNGAPTNVPMYKFEYATPSGRNTGDFNTSIERYKLDMMTSVLADFLMLGHGQSSRGSQTLGEAKIDLFFRAIEGWVTSIAETLNSDLLTQTWDLNGFDFEVLPEFKPDMPERTDLDTLSNFVLRLTQAGARIFPDDDVENYLRDAANLPELKDDDQLAEMTDPEAAGPDVVGNLKKHIAGMVARRAVHKGVLPDRVTRPPRKHHRTNGGGDTTGDLFGG